MPAPASAISTTAAAANCHRVCRPGAFGAPRCAGGMSSGAAITAGSLRVAAIGGAPAGAGGVESSDGGATDAGGVTGAGGRVNAGVFVDEGGRTAADGGGVGTAIGLSSTC